MQLIWNNTMPGMCEKRWLIQNRSSRQAINIIYQLYGWHHIPDDHNLEYRTSWFASDHNFQLHKFPTTEVIRHGFKVSHHNNGCNLYTTFYNLGSTWFSNQCYLNPRYLFQISIFSCEITHICTHFQMLIPSEMPQEDKVENRCVEI